jgi:Na+/H+ antiporter NhaC
LVGVLVSTGTAVFVGVLVATGTPVAVLVGVVVAEAVFVGTVTGGLGVSVGTALGTVV